MNKYAMDLTSRDVLLLGEPPRPVVIDLLVTDENEETVLVEGYFDDNGDEIVLVLDLDDEIRTTTLDSIAPF